MLGVDVRCLVDHVGRSIPGGRVEQGVVRIEDLTSDHGEPLTKETTRVLTLLACESINYQLFIFHLYTNCNFPYCT